MVFATSLVSWRGAGLEAATAVLEPGTLSMSCTYTKPAFPPSRAIYPAAAGQIYNYWGPDPRMVSGSILLGQGS
jgi:hypothetical protein